MKTLETQLASTANSYTIDSKDIDMILDWLIDNRNATTGIVFLGMNANGKKTGFTIGKGSNIEELIYRMIKNSDDMCDIILSAMERYDKELQQTKDNETKDFRH